jgi:hypothetical protein
MDGETTNPAQGGSDNARPSDDLSNSLNLDDAASLNIDFGDEDDEDQGPEPEKAQTDPESEADETDTGQEADDETETDEEGEKSPETKEPVITLRDGTKLTLQEVEQGYMRERDYRHKTQELSNNRRSVAELQTRLERVSETIADFLSKSIPPAPPSDLMVTDPIRHYQELQAHQSAMQQVQALLEQANVAKDVGKTLNTADQQEVVARERSALLEKLPHLRDSAKMEKFSRNLASFASNVGFSNDEIAGLMDHRQVLVLHYAMKGMEADKARQTVKEKVANAPPVAPPQKASKQVAGDTARQNALRERFRKTGSIHDAAKLDWD